jgi:hypothetical protein
VTVGAVTGCVKRFAAILGVLSGAAGLTAGRVMAGRVMAGRVMAGRVMAGRVMAGRVMAGRVMADGVMADGAAGRGTASTPYAVGDEATEKWISSRGNALGAQGHQGEPKVRVTTAGGGVRAGRGQVRAGDRVMGEAQTMREKGEVWGLRVILRRVRR